MKAIVLSGPEQWSLDHVPDPAPAQGEVVVKVQACGICGTDLHTFAGDNALVHYPIIPGHEFAGTVVEVGPAVRRTAVGDRVAVDPSGSCGRCSNCRGGWPNLCPDKGGHGSRWPGGFAEYVAVREEACVPLDSTITWPVGALAEPLACVLHGIDRLGPVLGKQALVYGGGAMGIITAKLLAKAGARVQLVEKAAERRQAAKSVSLPNIFASAYDVATPKSWDVVVDATGSIEAMEDAFMRLGRASTLLLLGVAPQGSVMRVSPWRVNWHELTIIGSMAIRHTFQRAVELLPQLDVPLVQLVSHNLPLENFAEALELTSTRRALKVQICLH